mgnify:CR=1 FL=1
MNRLTPKKLREFNRHLFTLNTFDDFLVTEAHFTTAFRTDFTGQLPKEEDSEETASAAPCVSWAVLRPIALELVRGKEAPRSFSIVMKLPEERASALLAAAGADPEDVSLYLNIRYANEEMTVTSGTTQKTFSLDKTGEKVWDKQAEAFLSRLGLIE